MSGSSENNKGLWYGYLEAGNSSSPVIRDQQLETGNAKTVYLFNLARGRILEYQREIVEPKLRELKPAEAGAIADLDAAYPEARRQLNGRVNRTLNIPERAAPAAKARAPDDDDDRAAISDDEDDWIDPEDD
ncbi:MAG: hypothetical protein J5I92_09845 [Thiogranum sp.]|nr:hypothetical protein [Thiogranum sp.]